MVAADTARAKATASGELRRVALGLAVGCVGTLVFLVLKLPLPWFLGSLTAVLVASVADAPVAAPKGVTMGLRTVLGVAIGTAFTPEILSRGAPLMVSLAGVLPWLALVIAGGSLFFTRRVLLDPVTAFFAAVPGGLNDMVLFAEEFGANVRAVTLIQLSRNILVVFTLPLYVQWVTGVSVGRQAFVAKSHLWDVTATGAIELVVLGAGGLVLARALGLAGGAIVGPMILSGLAHAFGWTTVTMPFEIMTPVQVLLGVNLGAKFRGLTWLEFRTTMASGLVFGGLLLVASPIAAALVARVSGFSPTLTLMGYAPGGQAEINLLAFAMHVDVAFIAIHHLFRLLLVMLVAQVMVRWMRRRARREKDDLYGERAAAGAR